MQNTNYEHIPQEKFEFAQLDEKLHDTKLKTKSRSYFADALIRFRKNKSSVVAAVIIGLLVLFSIISPIVSPYTINDRDRLYVNTAPFIESIANKKLGIFDGSISLSSQNDTQMLKWHAIGMETGYDPYIKTTGVTEIHSLWKGQDKITKTYSIKLNKYYSIGCVYRTFTYDEFRNIMKWQDENNVQVIYPYVDIKDIKHITDPNSCSNIWYKISDAKGTPVLDSDGNLIPIYSTDKASEGVEYTSMRVAGDDGSYIYSTKKSGAVQCRVSYYNYYKYLNGHEPMYVFGTNAMGQSLFMAIGVGARFSLIFAILVSAINLTIGAIYGSIQGYYGGIVDLIMDRISDILSGIPFIVVTTLFQLHLAQKVGIVPSFLFAFVLTGWIGMAALTRKQFYRFKSQEYVFAARTLGASDARLMFKHIFPNSLGTIVTSCALIIPGVISSETNLTYLGIVDLQSFVGTSIGTLMAQGQQAMTSSPHAMFFPALFFSLLMISFNLFGNGLRDAFNPSTRGVED